MRVTASTSRITASSSWHPVCDHFLNFWPSALVFRFTKPRVSKISRLSSLLSNYLISAATHLGRSSVSSLSAADKIACRRSMRLVHVGAHSDSAASKSNIDSAS